jgi:phosphoenolpyruvate carboxylase
LAFWSQALGDLPISCEHSSDEEEGQDSIRVFFSFSDQGLNFELMFLCLYIKNGIGHLN